MKRQCLWYYSQFFSSLYVVNRLIFLQAQRSRLLIQSSTPSEASDESSESSLGHVAVQGLPPSVPRRHSSFTIASHTSPSRPRRNFFSSRGNSFSQSPPPQRQTISETTRSVSERPLSTSTPSPASSRVTHSSSPPSGQLSPPSHPRAASFSNFGSMSSDSAQSPARKHRLGNGASVHVRTSENATVEEREFY